MLLYIYQSIYVFIINTVYSYNLFTIIQGQVGILGCEMLGML